MSNPEQHAGQPSAPVIIAPAAAAAPRSDALWETFQRLGALRFLAIAAAALPAVGGFVLLYYRDAVAAWLLASPQTGLVIYVALFALTSGLALLPTYAQAIIGGFVFQFAWGTPAALCGFVGGALLGYVVAQRVGGNQAMKLIAENPKAAAVHAALVGSGFWRALGTVTLLRLPPNSPFAMMNLLLAATAVPWTAYLIGTLIGMAPRTAAMIYVGSTLKSLSDTGAPAWYFWTGIILALLVLGVVGSIVTRVVERVAVGDKPVERA